MLVITWPCVREGLLPGVWVVEPEASVGLDPAAVEELAPGARGEVPGEVVVASVLGEEPAAGVVVVSVAGLPFGDVAVAMGGTGVTCVLGDSPAAGLVLVGCAGEGGVVVVPLLMSWRLARATMLLAREASSRWRNSAAVRSFSNMPWRNFLGE